MTRRRVLLAIALIVLFGIAAAVWLGRPVLAIGVAYKAKMLCSSVFVSGVEPTAALNALQIDDLAALRFIRASVDTDARSVEATAGGLLTRRALYRDGLGCALALDGFTPPSATGSGVRPAAKADELAPSSVQSDALQSVIDRAFSEADQARPARTLAVVVLHAGRIAGERYVPGVTPETPLPGWSMAKTVVNALIGILIGQGRMALDRAVAIPAWQARGDARGTITIRHLLNMSSGLRFDEGMTNARSDVMRMLLQEGDAAAFAAGRELMAPPGSTWSYSSGSTNILTRSMRELFASQGEYLGFPRRALFNRIGMTSATMETDASGTFVGSSFMYATARDWARLGLLYLHNGIWAGHRILPEGWVVFTTTAAPADPRRRYGAHVWLDVPDEYRDGDCRLPADTFHAAGHEGQFVTIIPSRGTVVVRLGRSRAAGAWDHCAFVRDALGALRTPNPAP